MDTNWTKLYQQFDMGPLEANQLQDLYVELADVRGESEPGSVAEYLEGSIRNADGHTCQLVSGHQGSGKSTELRRLQRRLQNGTSRYFCVVCDIERALPLDDTDFPDLLLAIVHQTAEAFRKFLEIDLRPGYFTTRATELQRLLGSPVGIQSASLDGVVGSIVMTIRGSPESRAKIRAALDPQIESLIRSANEVFDEARELLKKNGFEDLVIIVDGSDKLRMETGAPNARYPGERLFLHRSDQTRGFACHVVYAIPMALAYSPLVSDLEATYGHQTPIVPVTKLHSRKGDTIQKAYDRFCEILKKRVEFANERFSEVFPDQSATNELIRLSAGQPRVLCAFARDCMRLQQPVKAAAVAMIERKERLALRRALNEPHWRLLAEFMAGKQPPGTAETLAVRADLIVMRALLHYRNDDEWLGVNPLVGSLPEDFKASNG